MKTRSVSVSTFAMATILILCGGNAAPLAAQANPAQEGLSDERVMELARGYVDLLQAGEFEKLWEHLAPQAKERFGSAERFRAEGSSVMGRLGTETLIVSEAVEPARVGMVAHKMYLRVGHYTGTEGRPVRLVIGLVNDGSIGGITARPAN